MQIIGEKINGSRPEIAKAIQERNADLIRELARKQAEAGANWIDVNAGTPPSREPDDLVWLVEVAQSAVDVPLSLDSTNPEALRAALTVVHKTPLINSISGEPDRLKGVLPLVVEHGCPVVVLAMDERGIPGTVEQRLEAIRKVLSRTREAGIPDSRLYIDPLVLPVATNPESALVVLESIKAIRSEFPEAHITLGLSNISFGLPLRTHINSAFLALAMAAGADSAILDPLDPRVRATIMATKVLLGQDRYCLNYIRAVRQGLLARAY